MSVPSPLARLALLTLAAAALLALLFAVTPIFSLPRLSEANSAPATPDSVSLTRGDKVLTASWAAVDGADKYHVTYSSDGGGSWHAPVDDHTNITGTSIAFSVDNGKSYIVGVRAGNEHGWSGWRNSPQVGPYTPPPPPTPTPTPTPEPEPTPTPTPTPEPANPPATPDSVSLTRGDGVLTASWAAVDGADKYHVTYSSDGGGSWHAPVDDHTNITGNSISFSVDNGKSYIVGVRAGNEHGWSGWRNSPQAGPYTPPPPPTPTPTPEPEPTPTPAPTPTPTPTPAPNPPDAPTGLTATPGDGSVTLAWNNPDDDSITGYEYNVNHNDTSTGNLSGWSDWTAMAGSGSATTSHTFTGLTNGKEYRYHVRAVNGGGSGPAAPNAAPWYVVAVPAIPVPAAPANLSVTPGGGYLDISWDAVSGATGYDVRAKTAGSSNWHDVASNITATSHRYTTDATIDYIAVRARNGYGPGNWAETSRLPATDWLNTVQSSGGASSSSAQSQSQLAAPTWGTITRSDDTKRRSGRIDVNWTGDSNATGYNLVCAVAWSESPGWNWHPCGWVDASTDTVKFTTVPASASQPVGIVSYKREAGSGLPPGIIPLEGSQLAHTIPRSYAVAIRAVSTTPGEASAWVPSASIRPLNPQLSNLTDTRTDGQIALSWTPNPWTTGYEIDCAVLGSSYTRCATLTDQDHSATQHSVTISTWTAGGTNYAIDNSSIYDIRICSTNTWGYGCHLAPLVYPNPSLTASNVAATTVTLSIANHHEAWYYKHTNTGATCDGPVSGASKNLTGLTAGTDYTYSAYSDSGCSTLLATASEFTTLTIVSVSTLGGADSGVVNVGNSGSPTQRVGQAFTTGSYTGGYTLSSIAIAFRATVESPTDLEVTLHAGIRVEPQHGHDAGHAERQQSLDGRFLHLHR